jgi:hypothetical protein
MLLNILKCISTQPIHTSTINAPFESIWMNAKTHEMKNRAFDPEKGGGCSFDKIKRSVDVKT